MAKDISTFKTEIKSLNDRKTKLELDFAKVSARREQIESELKQKYGITVDQLEEKIKELETKKDSITESLDAKLTKAKDYISKLEGILNGC